MTGQRCDADTFSNGNVLSVPASSKFSFFSFLQFLMELTFLEAVKGANKDMSVDIEDTCPRCNGSGGEPGTKISVCHYCNGTGMVSCV